MSFKANSKKLILFLITLLFSSNLIFANQVDQQIDKAFGSATGWFVKFIFYAIPFSENVAIPWVLFPLIIGAVYFTIYFNFVNFRNFKTAIQIVSGKFDKLDQDHATNVNPSANLHTVDGDIVDTIKDEAATGEVTHFQALTAALSGTVGLGNIAGVAVAISIGGAGATFWMIVAGLIGMASKFTECTLGVKYRDIDANGVVYGGPMYYLKKGFAEMNLGTLGRILAVLFAIMCIGGSFGGGNMFQANQAFKMFVNITGGENSFAMGYGWLFGLIMAVIVAVVIIGGIKSIARVTDKIVPFMVGIYVIASLIIIFMHLGHLGTAFKEIIDGAFSAKSVAGGAIGVLIQGFKRAAFSNEAGIGSASIAHSAVKTKYPASEGLVGLLEPFIDTVIVCTMTALIIIITDHHLVGASSTDEGVKLTSDAFASVLPWFPYILALAVILFAFSTMISWSYYGVQAWSYLFGRSKATEYTYKVIFCLFVIIGAASSLGSVIDFSDAMIFAMMVPNMVGLLLLAPKAKKELKRYLEAIKNS
ncbi:MAG: alanine:cation symporter family protein [Chitinophagales bacterium]|nr:alanine:cation symporter family protein [Chitinophagales bacterium]